MMLRHKCIIALKRKKRMVPHIKIFLIVVSRPYSCDAKKNSTQKKWQPLPGKLALPPKKQTEKKRIETLLLPRQQTRRPPKKSEEKKEFDTPRGPTRKETALRTKNDW